MAKQFVYEQWRDDKQTKLFTVKKIDKKEEIKMVKRKTTEFEQIEAFDGKLEVLELQEGEFEGTKTKQIHMAFRPLDETTKKALETSKTGMLHNFLRVSPKATDDEVPEGSNLDKYLIEVESVITSSKTAKTYMQAIETLKGKPIHYIYKKIGRAYQGYEGSSFFVPQSRL